MKATIKVDCPCCHGRKRLELIEHDDDDSGRTYITKPLCTHCEGTGYVLAEDDSFEPTLPVLQTSDPQTPDRLKRFELSRAVKRDHLLSLRVDVDDVAKILDDLYGPMP